MTVYKLTLTTEEGEVINSWSISTKYDYEVEDPYKDPKYDPYFLKGWKEQGLEDVGKEIVDCIIQKGGW